MRHDRDSWLRLQSAQPTRCSKAQMMLHIYHDRGACMAQLAACKRPEKPLEPECTCNILGVSPAAHYITYIVGISRVPLYKTKNPRRGMDDWCLSAQPHRSRRRLISSACGRLVLADDPPASNRQFFGVRETHQIGRARATYQA